MTVFVVPDTVRYTATGDGAVLLDVKRGLFYGLNTTGAAFWTEITGNGVSVTEAAARLAKAFNADTHTIETDLHALLAELREAGLITVP